MREVFTRWPTSPDRPSALDPGAAHGALPAWAYDSGDAPIVIRGQVRWAVIATALGLLTLSGFVFATALSPIMAAAAGLLLLAAWAGLFARMVVKLRRLKVELRQMQRWNETLFERQGISLWREDWSAARDAVLRLLQSGERDVEAYFAAHPDQAREIRKQVIIKDVNSFAVQRVNAPDKAALLGSLDSLLPDTDQTFIQWLIGFARGDLYYRSETHITQPDGTAVDTLFTAALPRDMKGFEDILVSDLDITEFKAAQVKLAAAELEIARASRATTLGALSASIAHEVNSPLAAIMSHAEASLRWLDRGEPDIEEARLALECVLKDAARAQAVVARTKAYLSNAPAAKTPQDLATLSREAVLLIERELRAHGVSVHMAAAEHLPPVMADAINIQQIFVNLMMNAAQAMSGITGPRDLKISLAPDGGVVRVAVSDQGPGIALDRQRAVFEPFYSTRAGGMGMGLAICRTCVSAHGGRIWVESAPGAGATFYFTLPIADVGDGQNRSVPAKAGS